MGKADTNMKTVLVVDDEELFTRALSEGLKVLEPSVRVLSVNDGLSARSLLESDDIDLLLTDLNMPGMDGIALAAYAAQCRPQIPVIVITAYGSPVVREHLRPFRIVGLIDKPADLVDVYARVRGALGLDATCAPGRTAPSPEGAGGGDEPAHTRPEGKGFYDA